MDLSLHSTLALSLFVFLTAVIYSSVGHGGASSYLAILSFWAVSPTEMATTALILNVLVSGIAFISFARAGHLAPSLTWPFVAASVPAAFIGGMMRVTSHTYYLLLAVALIVAAARLAFSFQTDEAEKSRRRLRGAAALPTGAGIGLLSGVVGIGGGIFLSPIMLLARWATVKEASATAACFVLVNSVAALGGRLALGQFSVGSIAPLLVAGLAGGLLGSHLGANRFSGIALRRLLALVLLVAAVKLLLK